MEKNHGTIDGKPLLQNEILQVTEQNPGHFIVSSGEQITEVFLTTSDLLSDGNSLDGIEVIVESAKEKIIRERFTRVQDNNETADRSKGIILKATMPGLVRDISVTVGERVQKQTQVLILEAMKMENSITAGFEGIVSKLYIESGVSVEKGTPLMEFRRE